MKTQKVIFKLPTIKEFMWKTNFKIIKFIELFWVNISDFEDNANWQAPF